MKKTRNSNLHVLVVSNHKSTRKNNPSGAIFIDRQIKSLQNAGIKITEFDLGIRYNPFSLIKKIISFWRAIAKTNPDIVHARYGTIVAMISVISWKSTIITFNGSDVLHGATISRFRAFFGIFLSNFASLFANKIICVSPEIYQSLWWCKSKSIVIPDGIDVSIFCPKSTEQARSELGADRDASIVLTNVARDPQLKGINFVEKVLETVRKELPNAQLILLDGSIPPDSVPTYLQAADLLLCASKREGSPNIVKEAMACNLPIISTDVGDVAERLENVSQTKVLPRDVKLFSDWAVKFLREKKRANSFDKIQHLSLENIAKRVVEVYGKALDRKVR